MLIGKPCRAPVDDAREIALGRRVRIGLTREVRLHGNPTRHLGLGAISGPRPLKPTATHPVAGGEIILPKQCLSFALFQHFLGREPARFSVHERGDVQGLGDGYRQTPGLRHITSLTR